jgi:hypothetical protein
MLDAIGAIDVLTHRRDALEREIATLLPGSPWATTVARLRCLRGVDTLTAVGLCSEIGDFQRFAHPEQLMSYLGLVPSEHTTGQSRRQGAITKTGSGHARRLLVEAAWKYRAPTTHPQSPHRPPSRPTRRSDRDRLQRPTTPAPYLEPPPSPQQATHDHRRRRRARTGRLAWAIARIEKPHPPTAHPNTSRRLGR